MEKFDYSVCALFGIQSEYCSSSWLEGPYENLTIETSQLTSLMDAVRAASCADMTGPWAQEHLNQQMARIVLYMTRLDKVGVLSMIEAAVRILDEAKGLQWCTLTPVSQAILYATRAHLLDFADAPLRERIETEMPDELMWLTNAMSWDFYVPLKPVEKLDAKSLPMLCESCAEDFSDMIWRQALRQA